MGIKTEFNPDLCLRNISELNNGRKAEECIPADLQEGQICDFLKEDQRLFWLEGEIPLRETKGEGQLSRPIASVLVIESTHFLENGKPFTKGKYKVVNVFKDDKIHFDGYTKLE